MSTACHNSSALSCLAVGTGMLLCGALGCAREERRLAEIAPLSAPALSQPHSDLSAGPPGGDGELPRNTRSTTEAPYDWNAWAINEGHHLFIAFNCNGCHGQGGGGEGPPLMDPRWRYGSEPGNVFASIVEGRPNGMPSFRGKLTEMQAWQLTSYVRALGGIVALDAQLGRSDSLSGRPPEVMLKHQGPPPPRPEGVP
jgi:cytochrome c oxidase cbb3-type subunit 3